MDLDKAKKARTSQKAWITRATSGLNAVVARAEKFEGETLTSTPEQRAERTKLVKKLQTSLKDLDARIASFDAAQHEVELLLSDDQMLEDIMEVGDYRDGVIEKKGDAELLLERLTPASVNVIVPAGASSTCGDNDSVSSAGRCTVRLPKLSLPTFSSDVIEWPSFWERFEVAVHKSDLDDVDKFNYLKSALSGEAARAIDGLSLTAANYKTACDLLERRYGRRNLLIVTHVQALLNLEVLRSVDLSKLRTLLDRLHKHVRSLEALNIGSEQYGVFLVPIVLTKLPPTVRIEWVRENEEKEDDIDLLLTFLETEIKRREQSSAFDVPVVRQEDPPKKRTWNGRPTAAALQTTSQDGTDACQVCGGPHKPWRCSKLEQAEQQERERLIKVSGLCFICLRRGHRSATCKFVCKRCDGRHKAFQCPAHQTVTVSHNDNVACINSTMFQHSNVNLNGSSADSGGSSSCTVLQTARVWVRGPRDAVQATILFDSGSDTSYVSTNLLKRTGLEMVATRNSSFASFGGQRSERSDRGVFRLPLGKSKLGGPDHTVEALEVPVICAALQRPAVSRGFISSLSRYELADQHSSGTLKIDLLIGLDFYWQLLDGPVVRLPEGPVLHGSAFGYVLSGKCVAKSVACVSMQLLNLVDLPESLVKGFWDLDSIGVCPEQEEGAELKKFEESVRFVDGRYEVGLLWKNEHPPLVNNRKQAEVRLQSLQRRLKRDADLETGYAEALAEMEEADVITEVKADGNAMHTFYLPHHPVVKTSSTSTKIRPVFDASAKGPTGVALNDCLESGPALNPNLVEVVLRWRRWSIGFSSDLKKAFLQVSLREQDRDAHRFLIQGEEGIREMRFNRVTFGVNCSPFLLNATVRHHLSCYDQTAPAVRELKANLYVDDWLSGADSQSEVQDLFEAGRAIMDEAGMQLSKWTCSNNKVSSYMSAQGVTLMNDSGLCRVLGVRWLPEEDVLVFDRAPIVPHLVITKRVLLSIIARLFDPVGFVGPVIMTAKILFQRLWCLGLEWDENVPEDIQDQVTDWLRGLSSLTSLRIPRCYVPGGWDPLVELHVFGDASEKAYGACVYIRVMRDGLCHTALVTSRGRVAPLKKVTLPRLELLACVLSARLVSFTRAALQLPDDIQYFCWTDSRVALGWLQGDPTRWKQFVSNRVREIQTLTNPARWFHCPGSENPADVLSRGTLGQRLMELDTWWGGPPWLSDPDFSIPTRQDSLDAELEEVGPEPLEEKACLVNQSEEAFELPVERWSSLTKSIRVVAWIFRFIQNARKPSEERSSNDLSFSEMSDAKVHLIRSIQKAEYRKEVGMLQKGTPVPKTSPLWKLSPMLGEDGLVKMKGRLQNAELEEGEKHPIIVPNGHFALLLVRFKHSLLKHCGVEAMLTSLRNEYWVVGARRLAKRVKSSCVSCCRHDSAPCDQVPAPLPVARVTRAPAFSVTGLDYAGPLFCREFPGKKFYVLLFTCGVVRAVHLELTEALSSQETAMAFKRFASRRGTPSIVYSDNAKCFRHVSEHLKEFALSVKDWRFIAPRAPWWGGWWERLVRSVKSHLKKSVGSRSLRRGQLSTVLCEIEACINSRPITFVGDAVDAPEPLTPSHFLIGRMHGEAVEETPASPDEDEIRAMDAMVQSRSEMFWQRWSQEYLRNLPTGSRSLKSSRTLNKDSVVLIREDNTPRMNWRLGRVEELIPGSDGLVRCVRLRTKRGIITRPIQRLHVLEMVPEVSDFGDSNFSAPQPVHESSPPAEPRRTHSGRVVKRPSKMDL